MQYVGNYEKSLFYYIQIYNNIPKCSFYEEHEEFINDALKLISSSICRVGGIIEYDMALLHMNINTKDFSIILKIMLDLFHKLENFSNMYLDYMLLYKNIMIYIKENM